jgi:hypothetical protein
MKLLFLAALTGSLVGCGPALRDIARETTPGVVEGGVEGVADRENQRKLAEGIDDELVAEATDCVVSGVVEGAMAALEDPTRRELVRARIGELVGESRVPLTLTIDTLNKETIGDTVDEAIARLSSEGNQEKVRATTRTLVKDVISAAMEQGEAELRGEDLGGVFALGTRELAKQATLGFQDAIDETRAKKEAGHLSEKEGNVLDAAAKAAEGGPGFMWLGIAGAGGFAVALIGAILLTARRTRFSHAELARRDDALLVVARAIKSTEGEAWSPHLRRALKNAIRDEEGGDYLRKLLRDHRELRLGDDRTPAPRPSWNGRSAPAS